MSTLRSQSEKVGEAFAHQVLNEHIGAEVFIGSSVEVKLQELAQVIYQAVPDLSYYGATVCFPSGEKFVAINTSHSLRVRYFTVAHELWHVLGMKEMMVSEMDHERAADRFAAALMMPGTLVRLLWTKLKKDMGPHKAIIMIADLASVPYEAMVRRVKELDLPISTHLHKTTDLEWITLRKKYQLTDSPLDQSFPLIQFNQYETVIAEAMQQDKLDLLEASSKLSHTSPLKAQVYQKEAVDKILSMQAGEGAEE
jgi:Zn-dependent peptidase ImmA (M78 family)